MFKKVGETIGVFVLAWILCEVVDKGMTWFTKEARNNIKNNLVHVTR